MGHSAFQTQTLAPIYELVEDERKRVTLRSALDDLLAGNLRVSGEARFRSSGSVSQLNHKVNEAGRGRVFAHVT